RARRGPQPGVRAAVGRGARSRFHATAGRVRDGVLARTLPRRARYDGTELPSRDSRQARGELPRVPRREPAVVPGGEAGERADRQRALTRADQRVPSESTVTATPKVSETVADDNVAEIGPAATTSPARSSRAWVKPGGISSRWWVTITSGRSPCASSPSTVTSDSRPPRSRPAHGSSNRSRGRP